MSSPSSTASSGQTVADKRVFKPIDYLIFGVLTTLSLACAAWFLCYWITQAQWGDYPILLAVLTSGVLINLATYFSRWLPLPLMRRPDPRPARPGLSVGVATTFVPGAESLEMLEETVEALVAIDYPHETWVLDEGDDAAVRALCRRLGAHHFSRKQRPEYQTESGTFAARTKHGNYNAWLYDVALERYEIIAAFDPDHVPRHEFLNRVLGYFDNSGIGYVQAAQAYYNQGASFVAQGAAEETYAYYSSIQMTSYALGYPIVTGCHNVHRASALREVGGFAPHQADDLLITVRYRCAGWRGVYVPEILARGLTPVDWPSYLSQQRRWARSVLDIKLRIYPRVAGSLPAVERVIGFTHGLYYLQGIATALQIGALLVMLSSGTVPALFSAPIIPPAVALMLAFLAGDLYRQRFFLDRTHEAGIHWRSAFVQFAKWPFVLLAAIEALSGKKTHYTITRKAGTASGSLHLALPHLVVTVAIGAAWVAGSLHGHSVPLPIELSAAVLVAFSALTAASFLVRLPEAYDRETAARWRSQVWRATTASRAASSGQTEQPLREQPALKAGPGSRPRPSG